MKSVKLYFNLTIVLFSFYALSYLKAQNGACDLFLPLINEIDKNPALDAYLSANKPKGTQAWAVFNDLGVDLKIKHDPDELNYVKDYLSKTGKTKQQVVTEIREAGGYKLWKGNWFPAEKMRDFVVNWAGQYRLSFENSNSQLKKFNKACVARSRGVDASDEHIFFGRNGGILNTAASYPTISAEKGFGIHPELAKRLPETTQWPNVANCAECDAVNQALWGGIKWDNIQIHTIDIRPDGTMSDVVQCIECQSIFDGMRVTSQ